MVFRLKLHSLRQWILGKKGDRGAERIGSHWMQEEYEVKEEAVASHELGLHIGGKLGCVSHMQGVQVCIASHHPPVLQRIPWNEIQ